MNFPTAISASLLLTWLAPQAPSPATQTPDFKVQIWGGAAADFVARMSAYEALRQKMEEGLPRLEVTSNPAEILRAEILLAARIRAARAGARRGDIFSRSIRAAFRRALKSEAGPGPCEAIRDDNPGDFNYQINGTYPRVPTAVDRTSEHAGGSPATATRCLLPLPEARPGAARHAGECDSRRDRGRRPLSTPVI